MMRHLPYLLFFLLLSPLAQGQQHTEPCGIETVTQAILEAQPELKHQKKPASDAYPAAEAKASFGDGVVRKIPVVFHVVYATERDNITKRQIEDGLRILNEDFRKQNSDASNTRSIFKGRAADAELEFVLAKKDPNGNCTDGITRTQSNHSLVGDFNVKRTRSSWAPRRYLNIWVTRNVLGTEPGDPGGYTLGYSITPNNINNTNRWRDGVVVRHDALGSIGTASNHTPGFRVFTHEVGHYLGMLHPFGSQNTCSSGDGISDTPPVRSASSAACNFNANSCSNDTPDEPDMVENFMDYAHCHTMFTTQQANEMNRQINVYRSNLVSASNLTLTGVVNPPVCAPLAQFRAERRVLCPGETVQFIDESEEGQPSNYNWSFPGSSTGSTSLQNPIVTYNSPGRHDVILTVSNSQGSSTDTLKEYIWVKDDANSPYNKLWTQSFEGNILPSEVGFYNYSKDAAFSLTSASATHGNQSLILAVNPIYTGEVDELISPPLITKGANDLNLFFDLAYALRDGNDDDLLEVFVSRNCGLTWNRRRFYSGGRLNTAGNFVSGSFVPSAAQWRTEVINFDAYLQNEPILIKFKYTSGGGNNFFLDNIRFGEGQDVSLAETQAGAFLHLFPNPSKGRVQVQGAGFNKAPLQAELLDLSGKVLESYQWESKGGKLDRLLSLSHLPNGFYLLRLRDGQRVWNKKLRLH